MRGAALATCLFALLAAAETFEAPPITQAPAAPSIAPTAPCACAPQASAAPTLLPRQDGLDNPQEAINAASRSAQQAVAQASQSAAEAVRQAQESVRRAEESASQAAAQASRDATDAARQARESAEQRIGEAQRSADARVRQADESASQAAREARESARSEVDRSVSLVQAARADATAVRDQATLQVQDAQTSALTTTQIALAVTAAVAGSSILSVVIFWIVVRRRRARARRQEEAEAEERAKAAQAEVRKSLAPSSVYSPQPEWRNPGGSVAGNLDSWLRQTREDTSVYGGGQGGQSAHGGTMRSANWPLRVSRSSSAARR